MPSDSPDSDAPNPKTHETPEAELRRLRRRIAELEAERAERFAEAARRKTDRRLEAILRHSPAIITMLDARGRYVLANRVAGTVAGLAPESMIGRSVAELFPPEAARRFMERIETVLRTGEPLLVQDRLPVSGELRDFETTLFPVEDDAGLLVGGIARDVTERNRAEAERRELEHRLLHVRKLESLGVMAGGIAHDFNNILMAVLGNLEMAMEDLPEDSPVRAYIAESERASRRAADLTRQMLAYTGRGALWTEPLDLDALIRESEPALRRAATGRTCLSFALSGKLPRISGDAEQLKQVVANLVVNAVEAIGEADGTVILATEVRDMGAQALAAGHGREPPEPGRFVCLSVVDTGCGMDAEIRARIFDPFFTTKFIGRGLGLSAVQGIVRGHGGTILVESRPGRGTAIRVLLPARAGDGSEIFGKMNGIGG